MKIIEHIEGLFSSKLSLFKETYSLIHLEAQLAKQNVFPLIISLILTLPLLFTLWITVVLLISYLFYAYVSQQILMNLLVILYINTTLLMITVLKIKKTWHLMSFKKTKQSLQSI